MPRLRRWFGVADARRGVGGEAMRCVRGSMGPRAAARHVSRLSSTLRQAGSQGETALVWSGRSGDRRVGDWERGGCGAGVGQARANFGLKGMLCFFRRVRNSAAKDIFL
jgi:hypothetical protein